MEQTLKYIGNSAMLSVPSKTVKLKKLDKTTKFVHIVDTDEDVISFKIIRPKHLSFPKLKGKLVLSTEMREMIDNPIELTKEQLEDPRIKRLLDEDFR